jgi:hypothetical protein
MPIARIVTRFPERAASLRKTLHDSGYHVEVVRPDEPQHRPADIEYNIDDLPGYADAVEQPVEREFIFAPHWRALMARFRTEKKAPEQPAPNSVDPSVSYARLEENNQKSITSVPKGPSLVERMHAMRAPLAERLNQARSDFDHKRQRLAQQMAERRAAQEEARRLREAELAKKREADRLAADRARAEATVRLEKEQQERQAHEARRAAEIQAQLELRRRQDEEDRVIAQQRAQAEAERQRREAEQRARLDAERLRAAAIAREAAPQTPAPNVERRRGLGQTLSDAFQSFRDWRETYASTHFSDTRAYAFRQYVPAAAGILLAFFLGWAIAVGGARKTAASTPTADTAAPTAVPAAVVAAPVKPSKPSAVPQTATASKSKAPVRRFRRPSQDDEVVWKNAGDSEDDEVTVIHHYPGKSSLARSGKKNGVKTISDLEQD